MATVTKKPSKKTTDAFIDQAGSNLSEGEVKKSKPKKSQVPLVISPQLLKELDEHLQASSIGLSRSNFICQAIKEKLDRE
ncbi:MAG: hypothetical protein WCK96_19565 [Methylococcales bacterium]